MSARYHPEITAQLLRLHYDQKKQILNGTLNGYPVFVKWYPGDLIYAVQLFAKHPQGEFCKAELSAFRQTHPGFCFVRLDCLKLSAAYILQPGDTEASISGELNAFIELAASLGLIPCCSECGAEHQQLSLFAHNLVSGVCLCPQCSTEFQMETQRANAAVRAHRPTGSGVTIGIVIMVLYLFLMLFILSAGELFGGLGAAVQVGIAILLVIGMIHKYGGTATRTAAVISIIVCAAASVSFLTLRRAVDLTKFNRDNLTQFERFCVYFAATDRGENPYEVFAGSKPMLEITETFADYTPEKLQASRDKAEYACKYHTVSAVLLHLPEGLRKVSSARTRKDFWFALFLAAGASVWLGTIIWKPFLRRLRDRFQTERLSAPEQIGQLPIRL